MYVYFTYIYVYIHTHRKRGRESRFIFPHVNMWLFLHQWFKRLLNHIFIKMQYD